MSRPMLPFLSVAVIALAAMACSSAGEPGASGPLATDPATSLRPVTPSPASSVSGSGSLSNAIVAPIVADAAVRANVPASDVIVVSAEPVTWPDGGLGCPAPGMVYPQVLVDGYQVIVQAGQQTFDYRGTSAGKFRICLPG